MAYIGKSPVIGNFVKLDAITAVNGQSAYTMNNGGSAFTDYESVNQFLVSLNGTIQAPTDSFTVSGSTLTFASNLSTGDVIDFIIVFGNSLSSGVPTDATVSTAKIVDDAVTAAKINNDIISGSTELASEPADTDEFLVSDAGTLKRIDYSLIKGGGKVLQVVQATDTSARTTTSNTYVTASNTLSVNITPSSTSSKILVVLMLCGFGADTQSTNARVTVKRDTSTDISPSNGFADNNVTSGGSYYVGGGNSVLDSPNTTSQVNYQMYMQNTGGSNTARVNNGGFSSLTCFEIGA